MNDVLLICREKLNHITPLKRDCGRVCGARCCRSCDGEETGMLLFPGEEALYRDKPGWKILEAANGKMVICPGTCNRDERPLACRLFPLLPLIREEGIRAAMDLRARAVCPLTRQGIRGIDPAFRDAVRETGELLAEDEEQRRFLQALTAEQDEIRQLRERLGGSHV